MLHRGRRIPMGVRRGEQLCDDFWEEPSLLFYSNSAGSGNSSLYHLKIPSDPPVMPNQSGTAGTWNFQLHPAFWLGMALCDNQSAPEYTHDPCVADSDTNIFDGTDETQADYIGKHPGTAFLELQFYPPGWAPWPPGVSCDASKWCASMAIFSFNSDQNTGVPNNADCLNTVGIEPANFAFITRSGTPHAPPGPLDQTLGTFTPDPSTDLFMNSGDALTVDVHDGSAGLTVIVNDQTTRQTGAMTASAGNGFAQVLYEPSSPTCHELPYSFRPMYSTSSEHTRVPWAAHSYNVAFSDEIGHFEYCSAVSDEGGPCTQDGVHDLDSGLPAGAEDDFGCFAAAFARVFGLVPIGGCLSTDFDFDGVPYQLVWPGTFTDTTMDGQLHAGPVLFTSPLFTNSSTGAQQNFERVAFEADLPRIESNTNPPCQRHVSNPADPSPGSGCVNPPTGANFYPFYSTRGGDECTWQLGGANIPGTNNTFGGSSTSEFGALLELAYPAATPPGSVTVRFNNFRQVLSDNPCPSSATISTP